MMNRNPEFLRNLWLELSPYRLLGMPVVLLAVFLLTYLLADKPNAAMARLSLSLFGVLVLLWGTRLSSEAVIAELRDRTWDGQRMSAIGPWAMTWGKLLGSTIYPWYGGLLCLIVFAAVTRDDPNTATVRMIALSVQAGLMANALALLASLQGMKKDRRYNRSNAAAFLVIGILLASPIMTSAQYVYGAATWYGIAFEAKNFFLFSVAAFLAWSLYGIYRLMRAELQMKNGAFAWLAFVAFCAVYVSGFVHDVDPVEQLTGRFLAAFALCLASTYLMAFTERKDPVEFRRMQLLARTKNWKNLAQHLPLWAITLLPLLVTGIGLLLVPRHETMQAGQIVPRLLTVSVLLLLIRDLGLLLFFNLAPNAKRADWIMVLCLGLLYGVVPGILVALKLDRATMLFWPRTDLDAPVALAALGLEAVLAVFLLHKRWKMRYPAA